MRNFNVIAKGEYPYKQTSEFLHVRRFLIVRKKSRRFLLLDLENRKDEVLTALTLQVEQFDVRGNSLGSVTKNFKDLSFRKGKFIFKKNIELHRSCIDCQVRVACAEYGNYSYRLGEDDVFVTYEKKQKRKAVNTDELKNELGEEGFSTAKRRYGIPVFLSAFGGVIVTAAIVVSCIQLSKFKEKEESFFLSNLQYEFVDLENKDTSPVVITGYVGFGGDSIVIPNEIMGHSVLSVENGAFAGNEYIENLTIQGGVEIGERAFENCDKLETVLIENDVALNTAAFADCDALKSVHATNLTYIGDEAFYGCEQLSSLTLVATDEGNVLHIGTHAFADCGDFTDITIDQYVQYGENCDYFNGVTYVENLHLQNYDFLAYESVGNVNKPLSALFGLNLVNTDAGEEADGDALTLKKVHIEEIDAIPARFTEHCNENLESFTMDTLSGSTVGDYAFFECAKLKSITFPKAISEIGKYAFSGCGLATFNASALSKMGEGAFKDCTDFVELKWDTATLHTVPAEAFSGCVKLKKINIPKAVTAIGAKSFANCETLATLTFATNSKLVSIGANAFELCKKLRTVTFPAELETIGASAFYKCTALRYVSLPQTLTTIEENAFFECFKLHEIENLSSIEIVAGAAGTSGEYALKVYTSAEEPRMPKQTVGDFILGKPQTTWYLIEYTGRGGNITLPTGASEDIVETDPVSGDPVVTGQETKPYIIVDYLFIEDDIVTGVEIPAMASKLGKRVFEDSDVASIKFLNDGSEASRSQLLLAENRFANVYENSSLKSIDFGARSLKAVGGEANVLPSEYFTNCTALETVVLPESLTTISPWAFHQCEALQEVTFPSTLVSIGTSAFEGCTDLETVSLGANVTSIGSQAFYGCSSLEEAALSPLLNSLGAKAFSGCVKLEAVSFAGNIALTTILAETFYDCEELSSIILPSMLVTIEEMAFMDCESLENVQFPYTLKTVGESAFESCLSLANAYFNGELVSIGKKAFYDCEDLQSVVLGAATERVGESAFANCTSLTSVSFGGTEVVETYAFNGCSSLTSIDWGNVQTIAEYAFADTGLKIVSFGGSVTQVAQYAFVENDSLASVSLNNVQTLGESAFAGNTALSYLALGNLQTVTQNAFSGCTALSTIMWGNVQTVDNYAFSGCTRLTSLTFGASVATIGDYAFENNTALETVDFVNVTSIGYAAFKNNTSLTSIDWSNVETVGGNAFYACTVLQYVSFGSQVSYVGGYAFADCTSLASVSFNYALTSLGEYAFTNCTALSSVSLPECISSLSNGVFKGCTGLQSVVVPSNISFISYNAFEGCHNLHEVYDLSSHITITANSTGNGYVAYNAVIVHTSRYATHLQTVTTNGFTFKYAGSTQALVKYSGSATELTLDNISTSSKTFTDYVIARYAFQDNDKIEKLTIGTAVQDIYSEAFSNLSALKQLRFENGSDIYLAENTFFSCENLDSIIVPTTLNGISRYAFNNCYNIDRLYYEGTGSSGYNFYPYPTEYTYYSACENIHHYGNYWNEKNGVINTTYKDYDREIVQATCTQNGYQLITCDLCGYRQNITYTATGHSYSGGVCTDCGHVNNLTVSRSTKNTWQNLLSITGSEDIFTKNSSRVYTTTEEAESVQTITFTAKQNVILSISYKAIGSADDCSLSVKVGANSPTVIQGGASGSISNRSLQAGQTITFTFTNTTGGSNIYAYLSNIKISMQ